VFVAPHTGYTLIEAGLNPPLVMPLGKPDSRLL